MSGKKEDFVPQKEKQVGMYVCGVTVYDYCHVGHARAAIAFDTLYRYLQYLGNDVCFIRNFTDIDDKIINRANEEGIDWQEVNRKYIEAFHEDMGKLNIASPTEEPKATDHIPEMLEMIQSLVDQDKAYESGGDVFYSIKSFKEYGCLSGKNIDDLQSGARVEVNDTKKDPLDFALWKKSKPEEPSWDSPWGQGRPGWHIECSAMSKKYLGDTFDIHGGGKDLVFPHHENEIAQSCGCTGKQPVRYWVHNGFVNIDKEKMSKSTGNVLLVHELLKQAPGEAIRLALLSAHYRQPLDWTDDGLAQAVKMLNRLYGALRLMDDVDADPDAPPDETFLRALSDDLNTPQALAALFELARQGNTAEDPAEKARIKSVLVSSANLMGVLTQNPEDWFARNDQNLGGPGPEEIERLIQSRNEARAAKNFAEADRIRDKLAEQRVTLEDAGNGTKWRRG